MSDFVQRRGGVGVVFLAALVWCVLYLLNGPVWELVFGVAVDGPHSVRWLGALHFFIYDAIKIILLLVGIMFVVGMARASLNVEKVRDYLQSRGLVVGLGLAVIFGLITPFCSCSSIPLFIGFVAAGIPLSITLTFLIASPLVSETALIMIGSQFGWGVAGAYLIAGCIISFVIGLVLSRFDLERWVEPAILTMPVAQLRAEGHTPTWNERVDAATGEVREIFTRIWVWVLVGVAIGAIIHGWVPTDFFASYLSPTSPFGVPLAAIAGVPLYANGGAIVPVGQALWAKGLPLGTVMSLIMAAIALSIPEAIMLRKVMKPQLLIVFFGSVTGGIIIVGYLFNALFT